MIKPHAIYSIRAQGFGSREGNWTGEVDRIKPYTLTEALAICLTSNNPGHPLDRFPVSLEVLKELDNANK